MTSGSGSPTLLCLLRALIGGFRPKHPLMDFAMLGEGLEGAQLGSQLLETPDTAVGRAPSPSGLASFAFCVLQKDERVWGLAERVYCVYMGAGC